MEVEPEVTKHNRTSTLKHEDTAMTDAPTDQPPRGRSSKVSTPLMSSDAASGAINGASMLRSHSNRGNTNTTSAPKDAAATSAPTTSANHVASSVASSTRLSHSRTPEAGTSAHKRHQHYHAHHRKSGSGAHILKQIASFNRSPDMDRHRSVPGEPTSDIDSDSDNQHNQGRRTPVIPGSTSGSASGSVGPGQRSSSRRSAAHRESSTVATVAAASAAAQAAATSGRVSRASRQRGLDKEAEHPPPRSAQPSHSRNRTPEVEEYPALETDGDTHLRGGAGEPEDGPPVEPELEPDVDMNGDEDVEEDDEEEEIIDDDEDEEESEPIVQQVDDDDELDEEEEDPNEPKYCYCGRGSYGEMIACDNEDCSVEWFHLPCTGLKTVPGDNSEFRQIPDPMLSAPY